jgi:glucose-1-phosphate thymidylyltransferase
MKLKAIIAAGGKGTRLQPLTFTSNKHLIPIANRPLLSYPLDNVARVGVKEVGVIVNPDTKKSVIEYIGTGSKWGMKATYIDQAEPLGLAHVVQISEKFLGKDPFVYHLGDNIVSNGGIKDPVEHFVKSGADAVLTVVEHPENFRLGVPFFDKKGNLVSIVEKPEKPPNKFGVPGLYMFNHHVFEAFSGKDKIKPSARGEYEIVSLYNYLLKKGYKVEVAEFKGEWRDPGKFDDSLEANQLMLKHRVKTKIEGKVDRDTKISGEVEIGKGSVVKKSQIIGPVSIGKNVTIKGSVIGQFTSIDDDCEIFNSKVENSILMRGISIRDVKGTIKASMMGKHTTVLGVKSNDPDISFTVADHCKIEL